MREEQRRAAVLAAERQLKSEDEDPNEQERRRQRLEKAEWQKVFPYRAAKTCRARMLPFETTILIQQYQSNARMWR